MTFRMMMHVQQLSEEVGDLFRLILDGFLARWARDRGLVRTRSVFSALGLIYFFCPSKFLQNSMPRPKIQLLMVIEFRNFSPNILSSPCYLNR